MFKIRPLVAGQIMPFGLSKGDNWVAARAKTFLQIYIPLPFVYKEKSWWDWGGWDDPQEEWGCQCFMIRFSWNFVCWGTSWRPFQEKTKIL